MTPELSVLVPVYKEEDNISEFLQRILPILNGSLKDFEIIFVLDPSPDRTEEIILAHHVEDKRIKLLKLSRRFGQPMAILAGLSRSSGSAVVVIDVDLQDPPELIPEMLVKWKEGYDVIYAQRRTRKGETLVKRMVARAGYKLISVISDVPIPVNTGEFRLMSRRVVEELNRLQETHGFLRGMVATVGFRQTAILFDRPARVSGKTKYNRWFGSIRIGMHGLIGYSNVLLDVSTFTGFAIAGFSFLLGLAYLIMKLRGFPFPLSNPTIVVSVLFLGGIQLISIGILGQYIARIYEEVKRRPKFILDRAIGFDNN